ncbi:DUF4238 domain-containing protein [Paenibacillus alginolyticus]|uniref:DUF4238 domain-containing protein n=1 Tax=Paenibacillus alginolyticus TaxID=59839 RepID=UPI0003FF9E68|nr:DUF4238 domain-containing protein [Paenibacillus alginolyticus]MCY9666484.1 DUF4238 domain-containing protein [Paenibacillus alginolyticus]
MSEAKFHHYVPRFYLSNFNNQSNKLWIYDKKENKVFTSAAENIAGVNHFYRLHEFELQGRDPLIMEKQFSALESEASNIMQDWFRQLSYSVDFIEIPDSNRDIMSLYMTLQLLRTMEARELLIQLTEMNVDNYDAREDATSLHTAMLWNEDTFNPIKQQIYNCYWIFGVNKSNATFYTSDHPILIKTKDFKQWVVGPRVFDEGMSIVFPLSPTVVLYCYEPSYWRKLQKLNNNVSSVEFTEDFANHENSGQVAMSNRFIFSSENNFDFAKELLQLIEESFKDPQRKRVPKISPHRHLRV